MLKSFLVLGILQCFIGAFDLSEKGIFLRRFLSKLLKSGTRDLSVSRKAHETLQKKRIFTDLHSDVLRQPFAYVEAFLKIGS